MALTSQEQLHAAELAFGAKYDAGKRAVLSEVSLQMCDNFTKRELEEMVQDLSLLAYVPRALSA
jgi:hypothetical protein